MTSFLVVYGTRHGQTEKVARYVGSTLSKRGHDVTTLRASEASTVDVEGVDAVLVGSPVYAKRHLPEVVAFAERNREALSARPSAFFQVSIALAWAERWAREESAAFADRVAAETGWRPDRVAQFPGAVAYTQYGRPTRRLFRLVSTLTTDDADPSRDYEYTDWDAVGRFANEFAEYAGAGGEPVAGLGRRGRFAMGFVGVVLAVAGYRLLAARRCSGTTSADDAASRTRAGDGPRAEP